MKPISPNVTTEKGLKLHRIKTFDNYIYYHLRSEEMLTRHMDVLESLSKQCDNNFLISGYSYVAGQQVQFLVTKNNEGDINWRESVNCQSTGFNNRMRAAIHLFDLEMETYPDSNIYITEQLTPMYTYFSSKFSSVVGSEFLGDSLPYGSTNENGVRNENLCSLSFPNDSFDVLISLDVFEHIPEYEAAFEECSRVLKTGGKMMWSVPFIPGSAKNVIRAQIKNGEITHNMPAEYHGDPLSSDGVLCFQYFGWEMLDQIREAGFTNAYALCYHSVEFGYLGGEQFLFFAEK